jgi:hypothetical protein
MDTGTDILKITNFHLHTEQNGKRGKENRLGFCFPFQMAKYKYINSSFRIYIYIRQHIYIESQHIYTFICCYFQMENRKWKPREFSFIRLPFAHRANGSLLFVRLLTKKQQKLSVFKWTKRTKCTKRTCQFMVISY